METVQNIVSILNRFSRVFLLYITRSAVNNKVAVSILNRFSRVFLQSILSLSVPSCKMFQSLTGFRGFFYSI